MAATAATLHYVPVGEYLNSVYSPDVDYVDGHLEERNVGEFDHATLQGILFSALKQFQKLTDLRAKVEIRVQVGPTRFRLPDVCLIPKGARSAVVTVPPALCVEVLSPRDTVANMRRRCMDYIAMGVPEVWIFDPQTRTAYVLNRTSMTEHASGVLQLSDSPVSLSLEEVFAELDEE